MMVSVNLHSDLEFESHGHISFPVEEYVHVYVTTIFYDQKL